MIYFFIFLVRSIYTLLDWIIFVVVCICMFKPFHSSYLVFQIIYFGIGILSLFSGLLTTLLTCLSLIELVVYSPQLCIWVGSHLVKNSVIVYICWSSHKLGSERSSVVNSDYSDWLTSDLTWNLEISSEPQFPH